MNCSQDFLEQPGMPPLLHPSTCPPKARHFYREGWEAESQKNLKDPIILYFQELIQISFKVVFVRCQTEKL